LLVMSAGAAEAELRLRPHLSGLSLPVAIVQDPNDATVQFVVELGGRIRVVQNGTLAGDFLDLRGVVLAGGERGLFSIAFEPAFPPETEPSGRFFVCFTGAGGGIVVARFRRSAANPLVADMTSRMDLRWPDGRRFIPHPENNHNGGHIVFGPDRYLYIGLGDGGAGNDPPHNAQNPLTLLGKMLRIDVNVPDADLNGYQVPPDNPFADGFLPSTTKAVLKEIWSFGLRNPWRFNFDDVARGGSGALLIGDVGQGQWEEVDFEPPASGGGRNYGWRNREGNHSNVTSLPPAYLPLTDPIHEYNTAPAAARRSPAGTSIAAPRSGPSSSAATSSPTSCRSASGRSRSRSIRSRARPRRSICASTPPRSAVPASSATLARSASTRAASST